VPAIRVADIAALLDGKIEGDPERIISGVRPLAEASPTDLSFLSNPKYVSQLSTTSAGALLVGKEIERPASATFIRVADPYLALALVLQRWFADVPRPEGISKAASIDATASIGEEARIGDGAVIGAGAVIGNRVTLHPGAVVGPGCRIGDDTVIYPRAVLYHGTVVGSRCIIHSGVILGADGFGFAFAAGRHHKVPQIGRVRIEDDVEIGANSCIDRAALGETVVGEGTKIDNLVQIGHNVRIGKHCIVVSGSAIAGSSELGDYCVLAGHAGVAGHLKIGSRVQVAAKAAVMKDWDGPVTLAGNPARPLREHLRSEAALHRLPELLKRLREIEKKVAAPGDEPKE
jgi:UDP-3-O-[3-hydroxymyristoyl] glucosamine N-acyltransferase